jgi:hypothetical protein
MLYPGFGVWMLTVRGESASGAAIIAKQNEGKRRKSHFIIRLYQSFGVLASDRSFRNISAHGFFI